MWLGSLGAISAATAYFLYRVYSDYYTDSGRHAAAEKVMSTPLYKGNPVIFLDVKKDGKKLGRMTFQLRKDVGALRLLLCTQAPSPPLLCAVPETVENFRQLFTGECGRSYKGTTFHHILPANYVVGGNVPAESGKAEAAAGGYFPDENFALLHNGAGVLSSASQIRDENGSLFFVTLNKAPNLNGRYVAFGNLLEGDEVLQAMGSAGDSVGNPTAQVTIAACGELRLPEGMEGVEPPVAQQR